MAEMFVVVGYALALLGIGLMSVPAACIVGGVVLFVAGGLDMRARQRRRKD